ncbi:hypothetical protein CPB84DRAFT_756092 [Gymnopilus junonius]|uniref:SH3 domain-containing protein n=1 Tax=Gymnopilus junonius TaxID=109634 RepID=A0A9P5P2P0_GYMJU|nr:hypothetical protein CPB84DRAFT_756092 [Gymnopilus junonius]
MLNSKHVVHRMVKVNIARAPQYPDGTSGSTQPTVVTQTATVTQTTVVEAANASQPVADPLPTSTAALAGAITFLGLALLLVLGACLYRRRRLRRNAPSANVEFNRDAFTEKKTPYTPSYDDPFRADTAKHTFHTKFPGSQTSISTRDSEDNVNPTVLAWKPQINTQFRVTNAASESSSSTTLPTFPKTAAEKKKAPRSKPSSLSMNPEEMVGSPPPSYDIASGGQQFPIPSLLPPEKLRTIPAPPTPPASRKSFQNPKKKSFHGQNLVIPNEDVLKPVSSPARSESFAPKDTITSAPVSAPSSKAKMMTSPATSNPFSPVPASAPATGANSNSPTPKTVRLMNVVVPYTPTLADELQVRVGDTVRVLQEYKDGWCFAQFVGKVDAPRGVIPLVCLEERKRVVPVSSKGSNSSMTSLVNWR